MLIARHDLHDSVRNYLLTTTKVQLPLEVEGTDESALSAIRISSAERYL